MRILFLVISVASSKTVGYYNNYQPSPTPAPTHSITTVPPPVPTPSITTVPPPVPTPAPAHSSNNCTYGSILNSTLCQDYAANNNDQMTTENVDNKPPGCYRDSEISVVFNTNIESTVGCSHAYNCICMTSPISATSTDAPETSTTVAPAPAPATTEAPAPAPATSTTAAPETSTTGAPAPAPATSTTVVPALSPDHQVTCHRLLDGTIYYPLYATEAHANAHSMDGQSHNHTVGDVVYHMPDSINGTLFHGEGSCANCTDADNHVGENGTCADSDSAAPPATTTAAAGSDKYAWGLSKEAFFPVLILGVIIPVGSLPFIIALKWPKGNVATYLNDHYPSLARPLGITRAAADRQELKPQSSLLHRSEILSHHV